MQLIKPSVELIKEENPFKKIEMAARTCYKSEKNITEDSAIAFYQRLVDRQHTAMLEHAAFIFVVPKRVYEIAKQFEFHAEDMKNEGRYLYCTASETKNGTRYLVSGNLRAVNESGIDALIGCLFYKGGNNGKLAYAQFSQNEYTHKDDEVDTHLIAFEDIEKPTVDEVAAHKYTTMRFTTDRGVTHELCRHRPFSFAQESTRYCSYNKEQFGGGNIKFIEPAGYENWPIEMKTSLENAFCVAEKLYNEMMTKGATAQQARAVLPNGVKTEIIVTGNDREWQHFFNLRSKGTTGAPHPDMKVIADMALELYVKN